MLKTIFDEEEYSYFTNYQKTPLHFASEKGRLEIVKYLVDKGADVNSVWCHESLKHRITVRTLINNFNDPFYQRFEKLNEIKESQMAILIENGML